MCTSLVKGLNAALDTLMPAEPGHVILGVMVENFVGGGAAGQRLVAGCAARVGCRVTDYTSAILAALDVMFGRKIRLSLLTPFMPVGDGRLFTLWCALPDFHSWRSDGLRYSARPWRAARHVGRQDQVAHAARVGSLPFKASLDGSGTSWMGPHAR